MELNIYLGGNKFHPQFGSHVCKEEYLWNKNSTARFSLDAVRFDWSCDSFWRRGESSRSKNRQARKDVLWIQAGLELVSPVQVFL